MRSDAERSGWGEYKVSRKGRYVLCALTIFLAGCATFDDTEKSVRSKYVGKPVSVAISSLGEPKVKRPLTTPGWTYYGWDIDRTVMYQNEQKVNVTGYAGNTPVEAVAYVPNPTTNTYFCVLSLAVNPSGEVVLVNLKGQLGACRSFAD